MKPVKSGFEEEEEGHEEAISDEQIIGFLKFAEAGVPINELCKSVTLLITKRRSGSAIKAFLFSTEFLHVVDGQPLLGGQTREPFVFRFQILKPEGGAYIHAAELDARTIERLFQDFVARAQILHQLVPALGLAQGPDDTRR